MTRRPTGSRRGCIPELGPRSPMRSRTRSADVWRPQVHTSSRSLEVRARMTRGLLRLQPFSHSQSYHRRHRLDCSRSLAGCIQHRLYHFLFAFLRHPNERSGDANRGDRALAFVEDRRAETKSSITDSSRPRRIPETSDLLRYAQHDSTINDRFRRARKQSLLRSNWSSNCPLI